MLSNQGFSHEDSVSESEENDEIKINLLTKGIRFSNVGLKCIANFFEDKEGLTLEVFSPQQAKTWTKIIKSDELTVYNISFDGSMGREMKINACSILSDKIEMREESNGEIALNLKEPDFKGKNKSSQNKIDRICLLTKGVKFANVGSKCIANVFEQQELLTVELFSPQKAQTWSETIQLDDLKVLGIAFENDMQIDKKQQACASLLEKIEMIEGADGELEMQLKKISMTSTAKTHIADEDLGNKIQDALQQHHSPLPSDWMEQQVGSILQTAINCRLDREECSGVLDSMISFLENETPFGPGQCFLLQRKMMDKEHESKAIAERHHQLKKQVGRARSALKQAEEEAQLGKLKLQALLQQLYSAEEKLSNLTQEIEELNYDKTQLEDELVEEQDKSGVLARDNEDLQAEKTRLSKVLEQCEGELLQANEENAQLASQLAQTEQRASSLERDFETLNQTHKDLQERFGQLSDQVESLHQDLAIEVGGKEALEKKNEDARMENSQLSEEVRKLTLSVEKYVEVANAKGKELEAVRKQRKKCHMENRKLEEQLKKACAQAEQVAFLREREAEMSAELAQLEKENDGLSKQLGNALARELEIRSQIFRGEGVPKQLLAESRLRLAKVRSKKQGFHEPKQKHHQDQISLSLPQIFKA